MSDTSEPSKLNANYNSIVGGISESVGQVLGNKDLQQSGAEQRAKGDAEYKAAQAQGYAEGTVDRAQGKIDNVVGAVTGDKAKQVDGQARHDKGQVQQEINS